MEKYSYYCSSEPQPAPAPSVMVAAGGKGPVGKAGIAARLLKPSIPDTTDDFIKRMVNWFFKANQPICR